jgi:hypothetical protein
MDRRFVAAVCFGIALGIGVPGTAQETIERMPGADKQQEVEILHAPEQQEVEAVDGAGQQEVSKAEIPTPTQRRISAAGKVAVGVLAAAVAIAASAASLLLL